MLKQWIRRKLSRLSVNPTTLTRPDDAVPHRGAGLDGGGRGVLRGMSSHLRPRRGGSPFKSAVTAIYFHWAGEGAIVRPATDVQFDTLVGISSSYQYFVIREGEVLMRPHSCWCPACFDVAVAGPGWHAPPFEQRFGRLREGGQPLLRVAQRQLSGQDRQ